MKQLSKAGLIGAAVAAALAGCGGVENEGGAFGLQVPPTSAGGIWLGLEIVDNEYILEGIALITETGRLHLIREDGVHAVGQASWSRDAVSGSYTTALPFGLTYDDGSTGGSGTVSAAFQERAFIEGTFSFQTSGGTRSDGRVQFEFDDSYNRASSLVELSGLYSTPGLVVEVSPSGAIFGQEAGTGCVINGLASTVDRRYSIYAIEYWYEGCQAGFDQFNGANFEGLIALVGELADPEAPANLLFGGAVGTVAGVEVAETLIFQR